MKIGNSNRSQLSQEFYYRRRENIAGTVSGIERKILRSLREITYHVGILMKDLVEMGKLVIQERKHIAGTTSGVLGGMDSRP